MPTSESYPQTPALPIRGRIENSSSSKTSTINPSRLLNVPVDIIYYLLQFLDKHERVLLGLTCKNLYSFLARERANALDKPKLMLLLDLMKKDLPKHFRCSLCLRLHAFTKDDTPGSKNQFLTPLKCDARDKPDANFARAQFNFEYPLLLHHAQLVMDRHFLGPNHGLPLTSLKLHHQGFYSAGEAGPLINQSWTPRIINDSLFLRANYIIYHSDSDQSFRQILDKIHFQFCPHKFLAAPQGSAQSAIRQVVRPSCSCIDSRNCNHIFHEVHDARGSCSYCLTDYVISISASHLFQERTSKEGEHYHSHAPLLSKSGAGSHKSRINMTVYHELGACRSVNDWKWRAISCSNDHEMPTHADIEDVSYAYGTIKMKWDMATLENFNVAKQRSLQKASSL